MPQYYEPEFKQQIVRLHIEEGRSYRSLTAEYGISKASICKWWEECQQNTLKSSTAQNDLELMKENRRLREELAEARKENLFLKKAAAFFAKGIDERHIGSSTSTASCLVFGGCCDG